MFDLQSFGQRVAVLMEIEIPDEVSPYDGLFEEWALDSLQAFQLIVVIEALADVMVPPPSIPEMFTVGDAYAYFQSLVISTER